MSASILLAKRYQLFDRIGAGGMGAVYKAMDHLMQQPVALKRVDRQSADEDSITASMNVRYRLALGQEFQMLATLHHPNIVHVLDYGFDPIYGPFFTMDFLNDAQTFLKAAQNQELAVQIQQVMQLLQALAYVHRRGIIHRDIKPANVLVNQAYKVKLLDFGLAIIMKEQKHVQAGTLAYMAPESIKGLYVSRATDLYAVGVLAYQILTGHYPYDQTNIDSLKYEIAYKMPNLDLIPDNVLGPEPNRLLQAVMKKLLLKRQADRFQDAEEVIYHLSRATGVAPPGESIAIRDSYLQASQFIGREAELNQLQSAMDNAIRGHGSAWLIAGEAGIGKSRLAAELRIYALVQGVLVLQGQGIDGNDFPYQIWRAPLRRILPKTGLRNPEIGILAELVPSIGKLLEREIPDISTLDSYARQQRLVSTIVKIIRRQPNPMLLILEDLQWVFESLEPLKMLLEQIHDIPLVIVGTFRDDEGRQLPDVLSKMKLLSLKRLDENAITRLCEAMIGAQGIQPELVDLLMRATEGNVMFIVEVLRELAEEAGRLNRIGKMTLPEHVLSGGIHRILDQRLSHIDSEAQSVLKLAAMIGRQIDLNILKWIKSNINLDQWLIDCSYAAVLEYHNDAWRFSHDILREIVLENISADEVSMFRRQIAEAIEEIYSAELEAWAWILFDHWKSSGNLEKEVYYASLAGKQSLNVGNYQDALEYFEHALSLADAVALSDIEKAKILQLSSYAFRAIGDNHHLEEQLRQALILIGHHIPNSKSKFLRGVFGQSLQQVWHRLGLNFTGKTFATSSEEFEALHIIFDAANYLYGIELSAGKILAAIYYALLQTNVAERMGTYGLGRQVQSYATLAIIAAWMPVPLLAQYYLRLGNKHVDDLDDSYAVSTLNLSRAMYAFLCGELETSEPLFLKARELLWEMENFNIWNFVTLYYMLMMMYRADFEKIRESAMEILPIAKQHKMPIWISATYSYSAYIHLRQGRLTDALEMAQTALEIMQETKHQGIGMAFVDEILAEIYIELEDYQSAQLHVEHLTATFNPLSNIRHVAAARYYLTRWEHEQDNSYKEAAKKAIWQLQNLARIVRPAQSAYYCMNAWYLWLEGKPNQAMQSGKKAVVFAQEHQMLYDEALALFHLGRFLPEDHFERKYILDLATSHFQQLGCSLELARVQHE